MTAAGWVSGDREPAETLGVRALNRALLARQLLLERADLPAVEAVGRLVGMQAQAPQAPYVGLWSRLAAFRPEELSDAISDRRLVRVSVMRNTIHLLSVDDCVAFRPLVQAQHMRVYETNHGGGLGTVDRDAVVAAGRALLEEEPRTFAQLGALLHERWPGARSSSLAQLLRCSLPLVQVPPRGLWRAGGGAAHTTLEAWTGRSLAPDRVPEILVLRYLAAFGPASTMDIQTWSGVTRLRPVVEGLGDQLRKFRDERGRTLVDLPDAPRPDADVPAPVRFVPEYDNVLLSHDDRTRVVAEEHRLRFAVRNAVVPGTVLVDGFARAAWKVTRAKGTAVLAIEPFERLGPPDRATVEDEAARLLAFLAPDEDDHDVRFAAIL